MIATEALAIFERHEVKIRSILYQIFRNISDVNEFAQEVFIRLLLTDETMIRNEQGYVVRIARNVALDALRHKQIVHIEYVAEVPEEYVGQHGCWNDLPDVAEEVATHQELEVLFSAVEALPNACRMVFVLCKVFDFSQKECGEYLNISVNTVEQHLTKATAGLIVAVGGSKAADAAASLRLFGIGRRTPKRG